MKLYIDDLRPTPPGYDVTARTSSEALSVLQTYVRDGRTDLEEVSFDHDLGGDDESRRVLMWMIENDVWPSKRIAVHSMNPVGANWLRGTARRYAPDGVEVV
jgi:hypothetical protein